MHLEMIWKAKPEEENIYTNIHTYDKEETQKPAFKRRLPLFKSVFPVPHEYVKDSSMGIPLAISIELVNKDNIQAKGPD